MIYQVRSARVHEGQGRAAVQWATKLVTYLNDKYPDVNVQLLTNVNGPWDQLHFVSIHESLATMEQWRSKVGPDNGYQELLAEMTAQELLVGSSVVDNFYSTVSLRSTD